MQSKSIDVGGFMPQAETLLARAEKFRTTTLESGAFSWEFSDRGPNVPALREAARLGMTGIEVDRRFGGLGLGFREKVRVAEILSRSSIGFAFGLINTQNVAARLATMGNDRHRDSFLSDLLAGRRFGATALTEPDAGSDFVAITTDASRTSGGWLLNGRKAWITNGSIADVILCYVQTDPDRGRDGIACFVVDGTQAGFQADDAYQLVSGSTVGAAGFSLDNYEAAEDDMIIEPGAGFRSALSGVNGARIYVAAMACAAVRTALGHAIDYGSTRESFGRPLLEHQGLAWSLADVANRLEAAEALTARAVDRLDTLSSGGPSDSVDDEDVRAVAVAAAHAKKFATEMAEPALLCCMQAMGAEGLRAEHVVGRLLSESRILSYVDGTTEMQTERISRSLPRFYGPGSTRHVSVAAAVRRGDEAQVEIDPVPDTGGDSSGDPISPSRGADGVFVPSSATTPGLDRDLIGTAPIAANHGALDDATRTIEFEPTGHVAVGASEPPVDQTGDDVLAERAAPLSDDATLPIEPPMPPPTQFGIMNDAEQAEITQAVDSEPSANSDWSPPSQPRWLSDAATSEQPSTPPMPPPPPPTGEPLALEAPSMDDRIPSDPGPEADDRVHTGPPPPPPPPPSGPPLSTEPPLPSTPPMPPGSTFGAGGDEMTVATPPSPPETYQIGDTDDAAPPPLPGDEHRLVDDGDDRPSSSPPLPPDSLRQREG